MSQNILLQSRKKRRANPLGGLLRAGMLAGGAWIAYSNFGIDHDVPLRKALAADSLDFYSATAGRLHAYADRRAKGAPLVLLHAVNAAASPYEMRPLFERYAGKRPVYALDLPGYGFAERTDRVYSPELFADAILALLNQHVGAPADVVALSLSGEFAARAALQQPDRFRSLSLLSPSGFTPKGQGRVSQQGSKKNIGDLAYGALSIPLWSRPLYDLIATRRSIIYFLQQSFTSQVPQGLIDYAYATSHQPGAQFAPFYFLSGKLFTPSAHTSLYEKLRTPTLVIYDRDAYVSFELLPGSENRNPLIRSERIVPTLGMPHFEKPDETEAALDRFWGSV